MHAIDTEKPTKGPKSDSFCPNCHIFVIILFTLFVLEAQIGTWGPSGSPNRNLRSKANLKMRSDFAQQGGDITPLSPPCAHVWPKGIFRDQLWTQRFFEPRILIDEGRLSHPRFRRHSLSNSLGTDYEKFKIKSWEWISFSHYRHRSPNASRGKSSNSNFKTFRNGVQVRHNLILKLHSISSLHCTSFDT